jgi:hypothetical protein
MNEHVEEMEGCRLHANDFPKEKIHRVRQGPKIGPDTKGTLAYAKELSEIRPGWIVEDHILNDPVIEIAVRGEEGRIV